MSGSKRRATIHLVYRQYSPEEMRDRKSTGWVSSPSNKLFGWSEGPYAIKLLSLQRDRKKYFVRRVSFDELRELLGSYRTIDSLQLQLISLRSNKLHRDVYMVTTKEERDRFEAAIVKLFQDACSLSDWIDPTDDEVDMTGMINGLSNLRSKYARALSYLGYHNAELTSLFDSVEDDYSADSCSDSFHMLQSKNNISRMIIFSFESVVKVLKDDM